MKRYGLISVSLLILFCICVPVFAQPNANSIETILIDDFDRRDEMEWVWGVQASNSVYANEETGEVYPKMSYTAGMPNSLYLYRKESDPEAQVLGVQVKFNRKGDNWFEVYPQTVDEDGVATPYEVPLLGTVTQLDFWAWGANYMYYLDVLVRDADGRVHVLSAGNLAYAGWKNVVVKLPTWLRQQSRLRSGPKTASFVGFRVRTHPDEYVDDFRIFFDQLRYSSYTLADIYDGYFLSDVNFDEDTTGENGGTE